MRFHSLLTTMLVAFLLAAPAVAEQAGGQISAAHHDIGRVETRIQKYDQALGVIAQLVRRLGEETECQGVCFFPNSERAISWHCAPKSKCDLHCDINPPVGGCE
jgi:hypothetical protein